MSRRLLAAVLSLVLVLVGIAVVGVGATGHRLGHAADRRRAAVRE